ncbi:unnamed protein product [Closterium sp. Naga37s-1]|nr:unnamed protein product [Closterium sp. Naga37s-1]
MVGREGIAAPVEAAAADAAEAVAAVTGLSEAADAAGLGAALPAEAGAAVAASSAAGAMEARSATTAAGTAGESSAVGTATASDGGLISPSAACRRATLLPGGEAAEEAQGWADSPSPAAEAEIAAVVADAVGRRDGLLVRGTMQTAAVFAETTAAVADEDTQGHDQLVGSRPGRGSGEIVRAARGKGGKKIRARPAPRRPGAGLRPAAPGPLLGWLLQGQPPRAPGRQSPLTDAETAPPTTQRAATGTPSAGGEAAGAPETAGTEAGSVATRRAAAGGADSTTGVQGTRRSARLGAISWGPPRGGRTPWMPAGRGGEIGTAGTVGGTGRGQRGGARGGFRGRRGGRTPMVRTDVPACTGPWRERHNRPETAAVASANEERRDADEPGSDPDFMSGEEEASEEISLDDETVPRRNNPEPPVRQTDGGAQGDPAGGGATATEDTDVPSPSDLAEVDAIWHAAGCRDVKVLQRGDQPFLVRRLPPPILDRYWLCMLAALFRLDKYPKCPGGWMVLQFFPRLTLRPAAEPAVGSRWTAIEARLHKFQRGEWDDLFEEAGVIPDTGGPHVSGY